MGDEAHSGHLSVEACEQFMETLDLGNDGFAGGIGNHFHRCTA